MAPLADRAQKIHQDDFRAAPPDLEAEGENPVGSEAHRHGRLANTAAHPFALRDEPVFFQRADDHGNGLRRKPGQARNVGAGKLAMPAHQRQNQPLIIGAHADLVGAAIDVRAGPGELLHGRTRRSRQRAGKRIGRPACRIGPTVSRIAFNFMPDHSLSWSGSG